MSLSLPRSPPAILSQPKSLNTTVNATAEFVTIIGNHCEEQVKVVITSPGQDPKHQEPTKISTLNESIPKEFTGLRLLVTFKMMNVNINDSETVIYFLAFNQSFYMTESNRVLLLVQGEMVDYFYMVRILYYTVHYEVTL